MVLSHLEDVPDDVFGFVLRQLDLHDLLSLQQVSKTLRDRIESFGISLYLTTHPCAHITLNPPAASWPPRKLLQHHHRIDISLRRRRWHALQIGPTWRDAVIPTLHVSPNRVILGTGGRLLVHPLEARGKGGKTAGKSREYMIAPRSKGSEADIIGAVEIRDSELIVGQYDGTLQRFKLDDAGGLRSTAHYGHPRGSNLHTMAVSPTGEEVMTTTAQGLVSLFKTKSPWIPPSTIKINDRAWSSLLSSRHPVLSPALYIGMTGGIAVHSITPGGIDERRLRKLTGPDEPLRSSAYDMTFPPSPSVHNPSLLLSAWFDSYLRLHDLRTSSPGPVMECFDPWQWADGSAVYSTTYLAEHHIAGGGARHGTVSLFDIRQPKSGWSVFSPNGKGSPVYALQGEGGRLWGVTERRAFVLAWDGSGNVPGGLVDAAARPKEKVVERPYKWNGRGGKWGWTSRYDAHTEGCSGYDHKHSGLALFDSLPVV